MIKIKSILKKIADTMLYNSIKLDLYREKDKYKYINLCSGGIKIPGYFSVDIKNADLNIDLRTKRLPFRDSSIERLVCISSINYFSKDRAKIIIGDIFHMMKEGGVVRFAVQDLRKIAEKYIANDRDFFFQKTESGKQRFRGETPCEMLNNWFYGGYATAGNNFCKFFYDFETLALMFTKAGFNEIKQKRYLESDLDTIDKIDNRPEQMFFLEAKK